MNLASYHLNCSFILNQFESIYCFLHMITLLV